MSRTGSRSYTKEFKQEAIRLALNSPSVTSAAHDIGIPAATLHSWIYKAKRCGEVPSPATGEPVNIGDVIRENQELKKRLARLEQEKAILKKAAAYFAKELE
jgi:transposase